MARGLLDAPGDMQLADIALLLATGAVAGLASIPHCAGMCGPLAAFACTRRPVRGAPLRYQAGRTASYAIAGAVAGGFGAVLTRDLSGAWTGAFLSWSLAVALGIAAWRLWRLGAAPRPPSATFALGREPSKPSIVDRLMRLVPREPALFGFLTALLPCGALVAALLIAAGSSSAVGGSLVMIGFATTSSVALLGVAWLAARLRGLPSPLPLRLLAVGLMVGAVLLVVRPVSALQGEPEACCETAR